MNTRRTTQHCTVDGLGVTTFVADAAVPSGPTVVIVPGAMDRAAGFLRSVRRLGPRHVVSYDRRGYATSANLAPSSHLGDHVADLFTVVASLDSSVTVVGHSQGALIALHAAAAAAHAAQCPTPAMRAIVSIGAWEPPLPWFDWYDTTSQKAVHDVISGDVAPEVIAERFMRTAISDRLWDRLPATMRAERLAEGPALVADIRSSRRDEACIDLSGITLPVVVGCGSRSAPQHQRSARVVAAQVSGARLIVVAEATHGVHLGHPGAFAEFIEAAIAAGTR